MARLRQLYPQNYGSSGNISTEIESIIRYVNSAELGNKTVGELLAQLFDDNGVFDGPVQLRNDPTKGLQYRVGEYADEEQGWKDLAAAADLRGEPGLLVGEVGAPVFANRADFTATAGATSFDYAHEPTDVVVLYKNGALLRPGPGLDYTSNPDGGTGAAGNFTLVTPASNGDRLTAFTVRAVSGSGFSRQDTLTLSSQVVFPFVHESSQRLLVFLNGILQREGGSYDYVPNAATDTITFTTTIPAGNLVTIMSIEDVSTSLVPGLMLEERFCDLSSGLILYSKISVADNQIPMAKVSGLNALNTSAARLVASVSAPVSPTLGQFWVDLSSSPAQLRFWDGAQWLRTTPQTVVPSFAAAQAGQFLRVNGSGTSMEWANVDLSSAVPVTQKGAANGVATLDSSAKIPAAQLPDAVSRRTHATVVGGAITDGNIQLTRLWGERVRVDGFAVRLAGGTASVRLTLGGVGFATTVAASTTPAEILFGQGGNPDTPTEIDARTLSRALGVTVSGASGASGLDIAISLVALP